eukprot:gnl/TRDRNA2_/TRDRNA2_194490_c0_seq1.p1 gnl/TRDRNA2_/TRDRNA2_194490_c0~~gnl/TRDRNA2_/TRDRNA2_194490_c0_seq1.p1  ORF type:complete len:310 (-),score=57.36 gnl/TRDRNA2_/TRDRNA2_194490_c0_seq1:72-1001(-)
MYVHLNGSCADGEENTAVPTRSSTVHFRQHLRFYMTALSLGLCVGLYAALRTLHLTSEPTQLLVGSFVGQRPLGRAFVGQRPLRGATVMHASPWETAAESLCTAGEEIKAAALVLDDSPLGEEHPLSLAAFGGALYNVGTVLKTEMPEGSKAMAHASEELKAAATALENGFGPVSMLENAAPGLEDAAIAFSKAADTIDAEADQLNAVAGECAIPEFGTASSNSMCQQAALLREAAENYVKQDAAAALKAAAKATDDAVNSVSVACDVENPHPSCQSDAFLRLHTAATGMAAAALALAEAEPPMNPLKI